MSSFYGNVFHSLKKYFSKCIIKSGNDDTEFTQEGLEEEGSTLELTVTGVNGVAATVHDNEVIIDASKLDTEVSNLKFFLEQILNNVNVEEKLQGLIDLIDYVEAHPATVDKLYGAIETLRNELTDETNRAEKKEKTLDTKIGAETTRAESKEAELESAIIAEKARAESIESGLDVTLKEAKTSLENTISIEKDRAIGVENALQNNISSINTEIGRLSQEIEGAAKYVELKAATSEDGKTLILSVETKGEE